MGANQPVACDFGIDCDFDSDGVKMSSRYLVDLNY